MSDHTTLTDTERDSLTECECGHYLNEHSSEGCLATVYDGDDGMASLDDVCACMATPDVIRERAITAIVAARVAQARADVIGLLRSEAAAHEALSQTWHDDMDIAALGFTTAADYLDGLTQGADHG